MCGKYFILFCLFLTTLLAAQEADHNRISIRLFPTQILSLTTAKELSDQNQNIKRQNRNELRASNLYGYQIRLMKEEQLAETPTNNSENQSYFSESQLIFSTTSSTTDHKITPTFLADNNIIRDQRNVNNNTGTVVYLIITQ